MITSYQMRNKAFSNMGKYENTKTATAPILGEVPPSDTEVEASVLGFILQYPKNYEGVRDMLNDDCFYDAKHKTIYRLIEKTASEGIEPDMMAVYSTAAKENLPQDLNIYYEVAQLTYKAAGTNILYSAKILVELRSRRQKLELVGKIQNGTLETPEDILQEAQRIVNDYKSAADGEFAELLTLPTLHSLDEKFSQTQDAYQTKYIFKKGSVTYPLMIPCGAITFIAAPTSHGKSTLLRCLALDMAKEELNKPESERGAILYFSFEEDDTDVIAQVMNTYIGLDFTTPNKDFTHGNLASLKEHLREGQSQWIKRELQNEVAKRASEFKSLFLYSGLLRIFYRIYDSTKLIKALEYVQRHIKVKAVFIDYIQLLQMEGKSNRTSRTEELKAICTDLKDFAVTTKLPVVCAAQLNREGARSPLDMRPQNMSESSDIEKIANVIVCMYNSDHKPDASVNWFTAKDERIDALRERGFIIGDRQTTIYATITKNRGGILGGDAVLKFNGNSGVIDPEPQAPQTDKGF